MDLQEQISALQVEIERANAAIVRAISNRKTITKDSPLIADCNAVIAAAREALAKVEVKLRMLYESKDDGE